MWVQPLDPGHNKKLCCIDNMLQGQLVMFSFKRCQIRWWYMTDRVWIPKTRAILVVDQYLLFGCWHGINFKYWILPQQSFLACLSSLQLSITCKHGKSTVAEIERHCTQTNKFPSVVSFVLPDPAWNQTTYVPQLSLIMPLVSCTLAFHTDGRGTSKFDEYRAQKPSVLVAWWKNTLSVSQRQDPNHVCRLEESSSTWCSAQRSHTGTQPDNDLIIINTY